MEPKDKQSPESVVREIKRCTRRKFNSEEGRKICEKVKITLTPEVITEYFSQEKCMYYIDMQ